MSAIFHKRVFCFLFSALISAALTACGGGGGSAIPDDTACNNITHDCETGYPRPTYNPGERDTASGYQPSKYESPPGVGNVKNPWATALDTARNEEYEGSQAGADRIGAAYAHARGYNGEGIIISNMGGRIDFNLIDVGGMSDDDGKRIDGYQASAPSASSQGLCTDCSAIDVTSHLVGIMVAQAGNRVDDGDDDTDDVFHGEMQGIAYEAKIKAVDIFTGDIDEARDDSTKSAKLINAIREASGQIDAPACTTLRNADAGMDPVGMTAKGADACKTITVMNNGWSLSANAEYVETVTITVTTTIVNDKGEEEEMDMDMPIKNPYYYKKPGDFDLTTITQDERDAWLAAVNAGTVLVFAQGDEGHNSINGEVQLYEDRDNIDDDEVQMYNDDSFADDKRAKARNPVDNMPLMESIVDPDDPDMMMMIMVPTNEERAKIRWSVIDEADDDDGNPANIGSPHARLASEADSPLLGKFLSVIALDSDNVIAPFSNGCGDAMAYCLGAPGVDIMSIGRETVSDGESLVMRSGTAQAAAYVSAAVAVVANTFPTDPTTGLTTATPDKLVAIILDTADDLGVAGVDAVYGHGKLNLARATAPMGDMSMMASGNQRLAGARIDNSGITLPTSFGGALDGFTVGFIDDYNRAYVGKPTRITRENAAFTLADTIATWESPTLKNIALDSNSKMQFTNYDASEDAKDTLIFTHSLSNHTIGFAYNEESKNPDLRLAGAGDELHFQKIRPIANDLMQLHATHKLSKNLTVKNSITSGAFDTGNRFNEAMTNLNYTGKSNHLTIGAGTLQEYGQFLGASGTGAYQLSDATSSQVTHLAITQNLPRNSSVKLKYTGFKTFVAMRYNNFANINDLTANEYQLSFASSQIFGKSDSLNIELIQPFAVTDGNLQQNTVLGYNEAGEYNNVTQNYDLTPTKRRQQIRMTWQNQVGIKNETKLFISMQYENHIDNLRDKENSQILGGISTRF